MLNIQLTVDENTYDFSEDFNCLPMSYIVGKAEAKTNLFDVAYADGSADTTNALTSDVKYKSRTITIPCKLVGDTPKETYSEISNLFSGKVCKLVLDDDGWYYQGRVQTESLNTSGSQWLFQLTMVADPYKYKDHYALIEPPSEPPASAIQQYYFPASRKRTIPLIRSDAEFETLGKNLLPYPYFLVPTYNSGVYVTDMGDGRILMNGKTGSEGFTFWINYFSTPVERGKLPVLYDGEEYVLSGGVYGKVWLKLLTLNTVIALDQGNGVEFTFPTLAPGDYVIGLSVSVLTRSNFENTVIKPMIRRKAVKNADTMVAYEGDDMALWEPYREMVIPSGQNMVPLAMIGDGKNVINIPTDRTCIVTYQEGSL